MNFSVLMTTYDGEQPDFLEASLKSVLKEQTVAPNQFVIVVDGPVSEQLNAILVKYKTEYPHIVELVYSPVNQGQSKASAIGFEHIKNELFARMDSDDICVKNRFERQLEIFANMPEVDVVGGCISEFVNEVGDSDSIRVVEERHKDIVKEFKNRTPVNNVTVMLKKSSVEKAGGYGRDTVNEDYSLYAHMWVNGAQFYNIQETLVNVRVGNNMVGRRRDFRIFTDWCKDQKYLRKSKKHSAIVSFVSCAKCFCFVMMPVSFKKFIYKNILRKSK